jgi:hypothetical protein
MPTVQPTPPLDPGPTYRLTGTKTRGTSIWMNGVEVVPLNDDTAWTFTVPLVEGENVFVIVTKDAAGQASAPITKTIIVDELPPVISDVILRDPEDQVLRLDPRVQPPLPKTNFSQVTVFGQVDDHLVTVQINGAGTLQEGRRFSVTLPLQTGQNVLTIVATSVHQHVSQQPVEVAQGTIPTIQTMQPPDRSTHTLGTAPLLTAAAADQEQDPITYQLLRDGGVVREWAPKLAEPWPLTEAHLGRHTIEVRARDAVGGYASRTARVYVLRNPVLPPP